MPQNDIRLKNLNTRIDAMVSAGKKRRDEWAPMYQDGLDYVFNNQTAHINIKDGFEPIQANMLYPHAMQEMALLLQRRANVVALPMTEDDVDEDASSIWNERLRWEMNVNLNMPMWMTKARLDGKVGGFYIGKVFWEEKGKWDEDTQEWKGRTKIQLVKPLNFGVDPNAESIEDAEYVYMERQVSIAFAVNRWPKFKDEILAAADREFEENKGSANALFAGASSQVALDGSAVSGEPGKPPRDIRHGYLANFIRRLNNVDFQPTKTDGSDEDSPSEVTILEIYFKDRQEAGEEKVWPRPIEQMLADGLIEKRENEDGGEAHFLTGTGELLSADNWPDDVIVPADAPKYPRGRFVLRVGDAILNESDDDQVWPYSRWPFIVGLHYPLPHVWQGLNAVEMAKGMQDFRNLGFISVLNHLQNFSDPMWKCEEGALADAPDGEQDDTEQALGGRAGKIVMLAANKMNSLEAVKPPSLGEGAPAAISLASAEIRDIDGVQEVLSGKQAGGKPTATEILALETNSKLRTGLQAFYEDVFLKEVMSYTLEISQANLSPGDLVEALGEKQARKILTVSQEDVDSDFDIQIEIISELPYDKERQKLESTQLYEIVGLPYLPRLFKAYEVKNAEEILDQMPEWQAYQQFRAAQDMLAQEQAKQQAQQQAAGGPQGPEAQPQQTGATGA